MITNFQYFNPIDNVSSVQFLEIKERAMRRHIMQQSKKQKMWRTSIVIVMDEQYIAGSINKDVAWWWKSFKDGASGVQSSLSVQYK